MGLLVREARAEDAAAIVAIMNPIVAAGVLGTYVDLGCRRQGIASALFDATFEARRKGYEELFTFVRADNPAALATYRKHGFAIVGTARRHAEAARRELRGLLGRARTELSLWARFRGFVSLRSLRGGSV